jgi:hypothetical protein
LETGDLETRDLEIGDLGTGGLEVLVEKCFSISGGAKMLEKVFEVTFHEEEEEESGSGFSFQSEGSIKNV